MFEGPVVSKGPDAFRTISEVADDLDLPQHVLRFWETRFPQIRPMKRGGGRRYYRPDDVDLLRGIRRLLYGEGYTIRGVQRILKEHGPRHVVAAGQGAALDAVPPGALDEDDFAGETPEGILSEPPIERADPRGTPRGDRAAAPIREVRPETRGTYGSPRVPRVNVPERREPTFAAPPASRPAASFARPQGSREAEMRPELRSERPIRAEPPLSSRIPAAPPDEPDESDSFRPPPADRYRPPIRPAFAAPAEEPPETEADDWEIEAEDWRMDEAEPPALGAPRFVAPREDEAVEMPAEDLLTESEIQQLNTVLAELLECKRILDQAR